MNQRSNYPPPSVTFEFLPNEAINACARLDFMADGLRVDILEQWGLDKYVVTLSREGLRVGFDCSFFHLQGLEQALHVVREKIMERADRALGKAGFEQGGAKTSNSKPQTSAGDPVLPDK